MEQTTATTGAGCRNDRSSGRRRREPLTRVQRKEQEFLDARGLDRRLRNKANHKATRKRKRVECPKEPRSAARWRKYKTRKMGTFGAASAVRRIDPATGKVLG